MTFAHQRSHAWLPLSPGLAAEVAGRSRQPESPSETRLLERRERGWQQDLVLLRQKPIGPARRRPDALLPGVVPHSGALIEARVGPDVYEAIGAAELDAAGEDDGRELRALGELRLPPGRHVGQRTGLQRVVTQLEDRPDRKSTRLNSSHGYISYAVFCLKKNSPARRA